MSEIDYTINESAVRLDGVRELKDVTLYSISITEQDLEWMRFQQEMSKQICTIFGISAQMLGVPDDRVVDGTIQPVPLALPSAAPEDQQDS